jgi:hypothetical protein
VWGCLGKTLAAKVQKLQNRAFRIITRENNTTRSADILNKLGVPNLEKRRMQQLSILMYKVKNKLVPDYLYDMFTNVGDVHDHNTRQSGADLTLPKQKTNSIARQPGKRDEFLLCLYEKIASRLPGQFCYTDIVLTVVKNSLRRYL